MFGPIAISMPPGFSALKAFFKVSERHCLLGRCSKKLLVKIIPPVHFPECPNLMSNLVL